MRGLYLEQGLTFRSDLEQPSLQSGEALIRPLLTGICATDLELCRGYAGFKGVPGHEFVGVVEQVQDARHSIWVGRRVVGAINIGCGQCQACRTAVPEHCRQRRVLGIRGKDGVFADYFSLPVANLYVLPESVPDREAVFAEPLAAALRVLQQLGELDVERVLVLGPGRLGLLIAWVLAEAGYILTVAGRSESSLALPKSWQLDTVLVNGLDDCSQACVVDASGNAEGFRQALRLLQPRGILLLKSTFAGGEAVDLSPLVVNEIRLIGSRCGPFDSAVQLLARRKLPVQSMIDGCFSLQQAHQAFARAAEAGVRKIVLTP